MGQEMRQKKETPKKKGLRWRNGTRIAFEKKKKTSTAGGYRPSRGGGGGGL